MRVVQMLVRVPATSAMSPSGLLVASAVVAQQLDADGHPCMINSPVDLILFEPGRPPRPGLMAGRPGAENRLDRSALDRAHRAHCVTMTK